MVQTSSERSRVEIGLFTLGFSSGQVDGFLTRYPLSTLSEKLAVVAAAARRSVVRNPAGLFVVALRDDYPLPAPPPPRFPVSPPLTSALIAQLAARRAALAAPSGDPVETDGNSHYNRDSVGKPPDAPLSPEEITAMVERWATNRQAQIDAFASRSVDRGD